MVCYRELKEEKEKKRKEESQRRKQILFPPPEKSNGKRSFAPPSPKKREMFLPYRGFLSSSSSLLPTQSSLLFTSDKYLPHPHIDNVPCSKDRTSQWKNLVLVWNLIYVSPKPKLHSLSTIVTGFSTIRSREITMY